MPGARHVRCLAAPLGRKRRSANADQAVGLRSGGVKKVGKKCGGNGEKETGRIFRRAGAMASGRRRRLVRQPGRAGPRRPENNANARHAPGPGEPAAPATRRKRGTRAGGSGGERGERAPRRQAECRFRDVFRLFSGGEEYRGTLGSFIPSVLYGTRRAIPFRQGRGHLGRGRGRPPGPRDPGHQGDPQPLVAKRAHLW